MIVQIGLIWFGLVRKNYLVRWIVIDLFVHWTKEVKINQTGLGSRFKNRIFSGQDRQVIEDIGRLIGEVV